MEQILIICGKYIVVYIWPLFIIGIEDRLGMISGIGKGVPVTFHMQCYIMEQQIGTTNAHHRIGAVKSSRQSGVENGRLGSRTHAGCHRKIEQTALLWEIFTY